MLFSIIWSLKFMAMNAIANNPTLDETLAKFESNSVKFMRAIPEKNDVGQNPSNVGKFSRRDVESRLFVTAKNYVRKMQGRADIEGNDNAANLVDSGAQLINSLEEMDKKGLVQAQLEESPWSDFYWPLYLGQLGFRFTDKNFPETENWKEVHDFFLTADSSSTDQLSPAEKYDLLVGDAAGSLLKSALEQGETYFNRLGKVERWMGICHGWAPASFMMDRPAKAINVIAADGKTKIKFYPSDIKALASLLWASNGADTAYIGGRCNVKDPKEDANGRIIDQDCFDNNPGAWHKAVVNQIGVSKRSFVLDATFDYEVWNQPVYSYSYEYFNPQTKKSVESLEAATVTVAKYTKDKFKKYRSPRAQSIVGISMTLTYVVETVPTGQRRDSEASDGYKSAQYIYELELDGDGNIIGGEWLQNAHPDFLWVPTKNARALTPGDNYLIQRNLDQEKWDGKSSIPASWKPIAHRISSAGSPLGLIVESLIRFSQISN